MKIIKSIFIAIFILILFSSSSAFAHFAGTAPYLKINGQYTILYSVPLNSEPVPKFVLPEDNASENYIINQQLNFELDKSFLPLSQKDIDNAKFFWDFGDGTKATGLIVTHTYSKIGSYILNIQVKNAPSFFSPFPKYPFESVLINILPDNNYQLPQAEITANGKGVDNPLTDYIWLNFNKRIVFDATGSSGSSKIVSYLWDFGDKSSSTSMIVNHIYDKTTGQIYPMLRVRDENGFISDNFLELDNSLYANGDNPFAHVFNSHVLASRQVTSTSPLINLSRNFNDFIKRLISQIFTNKGLNYKLLIFVIIFAFFAGGLHALTPGHGKSLMAAFLIGKGGNKIFDVLIIALSITFAHTIVIYILGLVFLFLNLTYSINSLIPYFDKVSALIVAVLALSLIYKGYKNFRHEWDHAHNNPHTHSHAHSHGTKKSTSVMELFLAGASGGLTPCIDALALLFLAVSINQIPFGLFVVFIFSLGLASIIIALGLLVVFSKNKLKFEERLGGVAEIYAPIIAGLFILFLAIKLFWG